MVAVQKCLINQKANIQCVFFKLKKKAKRGIKMWHELRPQWSQLVLQKK
jgi:hypothetical protein